MYRKTWAADWGADDIEFDERRGAAITKSPRFAWPISRPVRAATPDGVTSFHCSSLVVCKSPQLAVSKDGTTLRPGAAREHSRYLERDGAIARAKGDEGIAQDLVNTASSETSAQSGSDYIERQEALAVGPHGDLALYTNISDDPEERREFWHLVEKYANKPGRDCMTVSPDLCPAMWARVLADRDCPQFIKRACDKAKKGEPIEIISGSNKAMRQMLSRHGWKPPRKKQKGEDSEAYAAVVADHEQRMGVTFSDARGGRIQYRLVGELPHDASHEGRLRIVRGMAKEFEKAKLPYTAVMHAPDYSNNDTNWHFHLIYYDRPVARFVNNPNDPMHSHLKPCAADGRHKSARKAEALAKIGQPEMEQYVGRWDFEVPFRKRKKSRNTVTSHPYRQNKLRDAPILDFQRQRELLAELTNIELMRAGAKRRVDPRTHSEMGIDREPDEHLSSRRSQLEDLGVPTQMGQRNEQRQFDYQLRLIERGHEKKVRELQVEAALMRQGLAAKGLAADKAQAGESVIRAYENCHLAALEQSKIALLLFEHQARSESRAKKVEEVCRRYLAAIAAGKASKRVAKHEQAYHERLAQAREHLRGLSIVLHDEIAQIDRCRTAAKRLAHEAELLKGEFDAILQHKVELPNVDKMVGQRDKSSAADPQLTEAPKKPAASETTETVQAPYGERELTAREMDDFIAFVLDNNVRLVLRDRLVVPQVADPNFDAVIAAPNYAEMAPRLARIRKNQINALEDLLRLVADDPATIELRATSGGQQEPHLRSPDKRLQAAMTMFRADPRVVSALKVALSASSAGGKGSPSNDLSGDAGATLRQTPTAKDTAPPVVPVTQSSMHAAPAYDPAADHTSGLQAPAARVEPAKRSGTSAKPVFDPAAERKRIADGKTGIKHEQNLRRGLHALVDQWIEAKEGGNPTAAAAAADAIASEPRARRAIKNLAGAQVEELRLELVAAEQRAAARTKADLPLQQQRHQALLQQQSKGLGWG